MSTVREILNVFQEAVIEELSWQGKDLNLKIECSYLADQISPNFTSFYLVLKQVEDFYFVPWDDSSVEIRDIKEIQRIRPDILSAEMDNDDHGDYIKVYSNCNQVYTGGNFFILAKSVRVFDEDLQELNLNDLAELADKYWYSNYRAEG